MARNAMQRVAKPRVCQRGLGACSPEKIYKNYSIWCVLENILLKFCKERNCKNIHLYIQKIDNALLRTLHLGVLEHTPHISCQLFNLVCFGAYFRELSLKKIYIYIYLNNIDMLLLRTSYRYGVFLKKYFKL